MSAYTVVDFAEWKRKYGPSRSVIIRHRIARNLVRLASHIDRRAHVHYTISHYSPRSWREMGTGDHG